MATWIEELETQATRSALLAAYGEWVNSKVEDGDDEPPLGFDDWLEMEQSIAEDLEQGR